MAENTKIEWADDSVSFWWGCTRYGEGCRFCYAEKLSKRSGDFWGPQAPRLWIKSAAAECHRLNRKAEREGKPRVVFINSMSDFFEAHSGPVVSREANRMYMFEGRLREASSPNAQICLPPATLNDLRQEAFKVFDECPWLRFMLLTKRPEHARTMFRQCHLDRGTTGRIREFMSEGESQDIDQYWRRNVWLGTSIATQADADRNLPRLRKCRDLTPVLFLSVEPLIERVELDLTDIDFCIAGGESGAKARPCRPEWIRSVVQQCKAAGVACFVKQLGANVVTRNDMIEDVFNDGERGWPDPEVEHHINGFREDYQGADCRIRLRDKKGGDWSEWPEDLRIREFPKPQAGVIAERN